MGFFGKNKKEVRKEASYSLPELPKLPDFPPFEKEEKIKYSLPIFPSSSLGTKFSRDTIKGAVSGDEDESFDEDEFDDEYEMSQIQMKKPMTREIEDQPLKSFEKEFPKKHYEKNVKRTFESSAPAPQEPIFVRIDKFEDSLKIFSNTKKKLSEIEKTLDEMRKVREKEEAELREWENEIRLMKGHIEKVDRDVFSKI